MVFEGEKKYKWASGSRHKASAQAAGEMCQELADAGELTAVNLLNANRSEDAPLHAEFEWDDSVAGEKYREEQAEQIIRHVVVVQVRKEDKEPIRAFFRVTENKGEYTPIEVIVNSPDQMEALMEQAKNELRAFQRKYKALSELKPVFDAIDTVLAENQKGGEADEPKDTRNRGTRQRENSIVAESAT